MRKNKQRLGLLCLLTVLLSGSVGAAVPEPGAESKKKIFRIWSRTCALCHIRGEGGAPRIRNAQDWQARLAQGQETLLRHTIEGYNNMPPLGYCMSCGRFEFIEMINYMTTGNNE